MAISDQTAQFAAIVLKHDPKMLARAATHISEPFNWQAELDNDPEYPEWLEREAEMENMRHARW